MEAATVEAVIEAATHAVERRADDLEITLEANPTAPRPRASPTFAAAGVNRVSLGLQSFDDAALRFLGRAHSAREGLRALGGGATRVRRASAST